MDNANEEKMYSGVERAQPKRPPVNPKKFTCFNKEKNMGDLIKPPKTPKVLSNPGFYPVQSVFSNTWSSLMNKQKEGDNGSYNNQSHYHSNTQNKFGKPMQSQDQ